MDSITRIQLENDIPVYWIEAVSFPEGIVAAQEAIHAISPFIEKRRFFGISRPEKNKGIVYRAAVEELQVGEAEKYGCERFVIPKGVYVSQKIYQYSKHPHAIGKAFDQLTHVTGIDPHGYCIEWYLNDDDILCMVRLA
jgi:hypothetical protein